MRVRKSEGFFVSTMLLGLETHPTSVFLLPT